MSTHLSVGKVALVLAAVTGGFHLCWAVLVALGWAQPIIDFIFWAHFIKPIYLIEPFEIGRAVILLVLTSAVGFAIGAAFALIWNALHKERS
jgi:hypothetical protein